MGIELRTLGSGPAVVFLHGAPTTPDLFDAIAARVAERARAVLVSLPGYGRSDALPVPWTLADLHAMLEEVLVREGVAEASFVGFCSGAYHAFALASRGRIRARCVVSLAGFLGFSPEEREAYRGLAGALAQGLDMSEAALPRFLSPSARTPANVAAVRAWLSAPSPETIVAELRAFADADDLTARVAALDVPIVARVGALDATCPLPKSEAVARAARRGRLEVAEDVGHALTLEDEVGTLASIEAAIHASPGGA